MSHKVIVTAFCRSRYNHTESIQHDMCPEYTGSATDPDNISVYESYMSWATSRAQMKDTGWISVIEVDMVTGLSTVLYYHANPLLERVELNKVAKVKKVKSPVVAWPTPMYSFDESTSTSPELNNLIASLNASTQAMAASQQFTAEEEPLQF